MNVKKAEKINTKDNGFWSKADRVAVVIAGGVALGSAIAQIPGTIVGGALAIVYCCRISR